MPIVIETREFGIAHLTLDRAEKRNALDGRIVAEWLSALETVACDPDIRLLLITASGQDFCAGADFAWMQKMAEANEAENHSDALQLATLFYRLHSLPVTVLVLVQGRTLGGGMGVVSACDMVIAAEDATFCFPETQIGLSPSVVSPWVIAAMGERRARYYFLTGEILTARQAETFGLVHQVVSPGELSDTGWALARRLLQKSPHAMVETRRLVQHVAKSPMDETLLEMTAGHLAIMRQSPDAKEGLRAFLEKRKPAWRDQ